MPHEIAIMFDPFPEVVPVRFFIENISLLQKLVFSPCSRKTIHRNLAHLRRKP
jgi:hypothetical protein